MTGITISKQDLQQLVLAAGFIVAEWPGWVAREDEQALGELVAAGLAVTRSHDTIELSPKLTAALGNAQRSLITRPPGDNHGSL